MDSTAKNARRLSADYTARLRPQASERSTKIHEITLTKFVFVRVISWIVGSVKTVLKKQEIRPLYYRLIIRSGRNLCNNRRSFSRTLPCSYGICVICG